MRRARLNQAFGGGAAMPTINGLFPQMRSAKSKRPRSIPPMKRQYLDNRRRKTLSKLSFAFAVALSVTAIPLRSVAETELQPNITANAFLALCTPQGPSYQACVWYVVGYADGLGFTNATLQKLGRQPLYCVPSTSSNLTGVQMVDVLLAYVKRHPEHRHKFISTLIIDSFKEEWPCP
jgi:Rap1a immunity proteins